MKTIIANIIQTIMIGIIVSVLAFLIEWRINMGIPAEPDDPFGDLPGFVPVPEYDGYESVGEVDPYDI